MKPATVTGEDVPVLLVAVVASVGLGSAVAASVSWQRLAAGEPSTASAPPPAIPSGTVADTRRQSPTPTPTPTHASDAAPNTATLPPDARPPGDTTSGAPTNNIVATAASGQRTTQPGCTPLVVQYRVGSGSLPSQAAAPVTEFATWLTSHAGTVVVEGHADARGSELANMELSRRRAAAIATLLIRQGVDKARITVRGFGTYWPVEQAPLDASWNRRAVVQFHGPDCPSLEPKVIEP